MSKYRWPRVFVFFPIVLGLCRLGTWATVAASGSGINRTFVIPATSAPVNSGLTTTENETPHNDVRPDTQPCHPILRPGDRFRLPGMMPEQPVELTRYIFFTGGMEYCFDTMPPLYFLRIAGGLSVRAGPIQA